MTPMNGSDLETLIRRSLADLPDDRRVAVTLRDIERMSIEDAAALVGIRPAAFKRRLRRARMQLCESLSPYLGSDHPAGYGQPPSRLSRPICAEQGRRPMSDASAESTMRAAAIDEFGPPENLRIVERPIPEPAENEISIDVQYAGVGFVDTLLRSGAFPMSTPLVPGIEVTGRVRAIGPGVEDRAVGEIVAALLNDFGRTQRAGGYAEVAIAHHTMVAPVPEHVDLARVTTVITNGATAWIALREVARLHPQERVLVLGASGGLGATAARLAALLPAAQVIGVVGRDPSHAPTECTDVILADELESQLDKLTRDGTVDVVLDPVGGPLRAAAYRRLAPFGRHIVLGDASGEDTPFSGDDAWLQTRLIAGLSIGGIAHLRPELINEALSAVISLVSRGALHEPTPAIAPLDAAAAVHQALANRTAPTKTLLSLSPAWSAADAHLS